ncbi:MAG: sensor domain-containing protein [Cellvibrionaceae bacterium]
MREIVPPPSTPSQLLLPEHLLKGSEGKFTQLLFNSLSSAVLYLDQWGRICSANVKANELFRQDDLLDKTVLEFLMGWEDPVHCHQEVLKVARTGTSIIGAIERAVIHEKEHWFQTDKVAIHDEENGIKGVLMTLDDITELKVQEVNLQQSEARYRAFVENSQDAIWRFDISPPIPVDWPKVAITEAILQRAKLGDCNYIFAKVYGADSPEKLKGLTLKETGSRTYAMDTEAFVAGDFRLNTQEIVWKTRSGDSICLQTSANGTIENNELVEIWGVTRDTTERRRYVDRLEYQATHDILTGLPNRVKLQSVVNATIEAKKEGESLALIIIDLDSFKEINDTLGHHVGDHIIKGIGPRIKHQVTSLHGTIARLGGDEFAILLPNVDSARHAHIIAEQILSSIRKDFFIDEMAIELRASLGISLYPNQANDFSTLMRYADVAMYTAKQAMTSIEVYNPDADRHSPKRLSLMSELGKAIRESQLTLYYQPKIDVHTKEMVGVEALSRWIHPTMGFVSPAEFIPIAEMTDMINEMTEWVLDESLQQVRRWQGKGLNIKVAVNISARNLLNDTILQKIEWLLHRYALPPSCLELEITESTIMNNADRSLKILEQINNLGIDLSIDDFGTGYSSLAYLKKLPVRWLKIDYAFIINMLEDEQDQIIVNSTINMAHNLGLSVVAEGVENQEILSRLSSMQCEQAQGYHIARPMPADELEEWYNNYTKAV